MAERETKPVLHFPSRRSVDRGHYSSDSGVGIFPTYPTGEGFHLEVTCHSPERTEKKRAKPAGRLRALRRRQCGPCADRGRNAICQPDAFHSCMLLRRTLSSLRPVRHSNFLHSSARPFPSRPSHSPSVLLASAVAFHSTTSSDSSMAPITHTTVEAATEPPSTHNQVVIIGSGPAGKPRLPLVSPSPLCVGPGSFAHVARTMPVKCWNGF